MTKVVIIEDEPVTRLLLVKTISQWGYETLDFECAEDALSYFENETGWEGKELRMVLTDWSLPNMTGLELTEMLKGQLKSHGPFYIVMLTQKAEVKSLVKAMDCGVDDYIIKPFIPEELRVRLRAGERVLAQTLKLKYLASHDDLTGVLNRRALMKQLENVWAKFERDKQPSSVLMLDLDKFKSINDTHGHIVGDKVLKKLASVLQTILRPYDFVGRFGGEEFVALLTDTHIQEASLVAERIRVAIESTSLTIEPNKDLNFTASIGVAQFISSDNSAEKTLSRADAAMYEAKSQGRNQVVTCRDSSTL